MAPKPVYTISAKQTTAALRAYWPDIYTVPFSQLLLSSQSKIYFRIRFCQVLQILLSIFSSFHLFPSLKYQVFNFTTRRNNSNRNSIGILFGGAFLNNFYSFKLILTRKVEKFQKMTLVTSYLYLFVVLKHFRLEFCRRHQNLSKSPLRIPTEFQ